MFEPDNGAADYNQHTFTAASLRRAQDAGNPDFNPALHVGMEAPDFVATDLDGRTVRLSDFRGAAHVAFELGSITGPVFVNDLPSLHELQEQFGEQGVQVLVVYTREAHPGDHYGRHTSFEQKQQHARDLQKLENVTVPILVDSLEGDTHRAYGLRASPVFVVSRDGVLVYKASWLIADELRLVLARLVTLDTPGGRRGLLRNSYSEHRTTLGMSPAVRERVFARAGAGARGDAEAARLWL